MHYAVLATMPYDLITTRFPIYAGTAVINITQCEIASAIFDFYNLVPNKFMLSLYVVAMTASNIVALDTIVVMARQNNNKSIY